MDVAFARHLASVVAHERSEAEAYLAFRMHKLQQAGDQQVFALFIILLSVEFARGKGSAAKPELFMYCTRGERASSRGCALEQNLACRSTFVAFSVDELKTWGLLSRVEVKIEHCLLCPAHFIIWCEYRHMWCAFFCGQVEELTSALRTALGGGTPGGWLRV